MHLQSLHLFLFLVTDARRISRRRREMTRLLARHDLPPFTFSYLYDKILFNMAIKVTRKDQGEANENIIRRFNRKVLQSGMMPLKKSQMRFSKPISKRERRVKAIIREARKAEKTEKIKLGLK